MMKKNILAATIATLMIGGLEAQAADSTWTGGGSSINWSGPSNWSDGIPGLSDWGIFGTTSINKLDGINLVGVTSLASIRVTDPAADIVITNGSNIRLANIDMSTASRDMTIHNITAGSFIGQKDNAALSINVAAGRTFTYDSPDAASQIQLEKNTLTLAGAGTVNMMTRNFELGRSSALATDATTLNLSAGTMRVNGDLARSFRMWVGNNTVNQTGGRMEADTVNMGLSATAHANTYNLDGGTLQVGRIFSSVTGGGTETFVFNGGTVEARASGLNTNDFISTSLESVRIDAGGGTIDSAGYDIQVSKAMTGVGALTKTGDGTLTLNGANTYAGGTIVAAGTLVVSLDKAFGSGNVTVADNAVLTLNSGVVNTQADVIVGTTGLINLDFDGTNLVNSLSLDGGLTFVSSGLYGASESNLSGTGFLQVIPEPATFGLIGFAAAGLLGIRRLLVL